MYKKMSVFFVLVFFLIICSFFKISAKTLIDDHINSINQVFYEKFDEYPTNYELLYDFNDQINYMIAYTDKQYLVFDFVLRNFIIYANGEHPFKGVIYNKKYYAPPFGFYYQDSFNNIISAITNTILTFNEIERIRTKSNLVREYVLNKKQNMDIKRNANQTFISNDFYFERLRFNMPDNIDGSCSFVSMAMLLGYYDTFYNDDFVDDVYEVSVLSTSIDPNELLLDDYIESPGTSNDFQNLLLSYSLYNDPLFDLLIDGYGYNTYLSSLLTLDYLNNQNIITSVMYYDEFYDVPYYIRSAIDSDKPVYVAIASSEYTFVDLYKENIHHACIAYGYTNDSIIINLGWKPTNNDQQAFSQFGLADEYFTECFYLTYSTMSNNCDNYRWSYNGCSGYIQSPHIIVCDHEAKHYINTQNALYHNYECNVCNFSLQENHNFVLNGYYNLCTKCGYSVNVCQHNLTYHGSYNNIVHFMKCSLCDTIVNEAHNFTYMHGVYSCTVCGFQTPYIFN